MVLDGLAGEYSETAGKFLAQARGSCDELRAFVARPNGPLAEGQPKIAHRRQVRIADLVAGVMNAFEPAARRRHMFLSWSAASHDAEVVIDPFEFQLVFSRVLRRAMAMSADGTSILVKVERAERVHCLQIDLFASLSVANELAVAANESQVQAAASQLRFGNFVVDVEHGEDLRMNFHVPYNQLEELGHEFSLGR